MNGHARKIWIGRPPWAALVVLLVVLATGLITSSKEPANASPVLALALDGSASRATPHSVHTWRSTGATATNGQNLATRRPRAAGSGNTGYLWWPHHRWPYPTPSPSVSTPSPSASTPDPTPSATVPAPVPSVTAPAPSPSVTAPAAPPPPAVRSWPTSATTGVPAGVSLTRYTGPCLISAPTTLNAVDATGCGALGITANGVVITNSLLPRITTMPGGGVGTVSITDSEVQGGTFTDGAVAGANLTVIRSEITGGAMSVHCAGNCLVTDSYLHGQYLAPGGVQHEEAFLSNGGSGMTVRGNRMACTTQPSGTGGACTSVLSVFGDFSPVSDVVIEDNYFTANTTGQSYCLYGGYNPDKPYGSNPKNIVITNNVFEHGANGKCGMYGPVAAWLPGNGNIWSGNRWWDPSTGTPGALLTL